MFNYADGGGVSFAKEEIIKLIQYLKNRYLSDFDNK